MTSQTRNVTKKSTSQTVLRALSLLEAVANDTHDLEGLALSSGLTQSTAHRLLTTLVVAGYLRREPHGGYYLGPKLIELGFKAHANTHLPLIAHPYMKQLAEESSETVHLGVLEGKEVIYIDKVPGNRQLQMASFIGARVPAQSTALGKALISTLPRDEWANHFTPGLRRTEHTISTLERFLEEISRVYEQGYALDLEENEPGIRCIGAPIRDASGKGIAAVSISSATVYLSEERIEKLIPMVMETGRKISREFGWTGVSPVSYREKL